MSAAGNVRAALWGRFRVYTTRRAWYPPCRRVVHVDMNAPKANPYNLGIPLKHEWQFAGRNAELSAIDYYLDQAVDGRPVNIAIVGDTGVGKSSLMNVVECHVRVRGILAVRLGLETCMVEDDMLFFRELYDVLLSEAGKAGMFRRYVQQVGDLRRQLAWGVPPMADVALELPLRFPRAFAECASRNLTLPVMTSMVEEDLSFVAQEARAAQVPSIALMLDDCDRVSAGLIEKLREFLSRLNGFFLCASGTDAMLSAWNAVFSPVPRVFVKVRLEPFQSPVATRDCLRKPLLRGKYRDVKVDPRLHEDLHLLTDGNPYEIQLLCYFMYQRLTEGSADRMTLNPAVLERMLEQLESQGPLMSDERALQTAVQKLSAGDLRNAAQQLQYEGLTAEDQALVEVAFAPLTSDKLAERTGDVRLNRERLLGLGLADVMDDKLVFRGGAFGKLYLKYRCEAAGNSDRAEWALVPLGGLHVGDLLLAKFLGQLFVKLTAGSGGSRAWRGWLSRRTCSLNAAIDGFRESVSKCDAEGLRTNVLYPTVLGPVLGSGEDVGGHLVTFGRVRYKGRPPVTLVVVHETTQPPEECRQARETFAALAAKEAQPAEAYGISLEASEVDLLPASLVSSARKLDKLQDDVYEYHQMAGLALLEGDLATAREAAAEMLKLADRFQGSKVAVIHGTCGFVAMCSRDFDTALEYTRLALLSDASPVFLVNLAYVLAAMEGPGEYSAEAERAATQAIEALSGNAADTAWMLNVFLGAVLPLDSSEWLQDLVEDPVTDSAARCTLAVLLAKRGEHAEALKVCERAELRSSDRAFPLRTKARVLLLNGEQDAALDALKMAVEVEPGDRWGRHEYHLLSAHLEAKHGSQ